ncbi:hypothetical protein ACGGZK_01985 [Agromyces sp. MMS24-K17]|uniref:hypothetical protein n=1 Tax=Agromyces sp. MMS24-K17 TaxID=3372850 RepID=UPI00375468AF
MPGHGPEGVVAIEHWWPHLSIDARHRVWAALEGDGELDATVVAEITEVIGADASAAVPGRLSAADRAFIITQGEVVD